MKQHLVLAKMLVRKTSLGLIFVCLLLGVSCGRMKRAESAGFGATWLEGLESTPERAEFTREVKVFFELLRDKNWSAIYERRPREFREDIDKGLFLQMGQKLQAWSLIHYEVLHAEYHLDPGVVVLVCRFVESPGMSTNFSWMVWRKEDGMWRLVHGGPVGPRTLLTSTRWLFSFPKR